MNDEVFLTDNQVAARYQMNRVTVWRWVKLGKLPPAIKINGLARWRLSELKRFEEKAPAA